MVSSGNIANYIGDYRYEALNLLAVFLVLPWLWTSRRIQPAYAAFGLLTLSVPLILDVPPLGRMTAPIVPIYFALAASISQRWVFYALAGSFLVLQMAASCLFYAWRPLY